MSSSGRRETRLEVVGLVRTKHGGGLDLGGEVDGGDGWMHSGYMEEV